MDAELNRRQEILLHSTLKSAIGRIVQERPAFQASLTQALDELARNPVPSSSRRISLAPSSEWRGTVRRVRVGGRRGYRLVYWHVAEDARVLPFYVSPVTRAEGFVYRMAEIRTSFYQVFGHYFADTHEFGDDFSRYRYFTPWRGAP